MDDSQPLGSVTQGSQDIPKLGFLGKAFIGLGSIASGLCAGLIYINRSIYFNLAHALYATAESNLEAAMTHLNNATENAATGSKEEQFRRLLDSLSVPELPRDALRHSYTVRRDLRDANTALGKALDDAYRTHAGEQALAKIEFGRIAQLDLNNFIYKHPETTRRANHALMDEFEKRWLASEIGILTTLEGRETLAKETVRHVPWHKKVSLRGVRLTGGQKAGVGLIFAAVSSVAAIGLSKVAAHFSDKHETLGTER